MTSDSLEEQPAGGESEDLAEFLKRNRSFAVEFTAGDLNIRPRMSTILLTCVDGRVDPALLFRLELGDAVVIRNAGGRITPAVMGDVAILGVLGANMPGAGAMQVELVVLQHTDCGMSRLTIPAIQEEVAKRRGLSLAEVAEMDYRPLNVGAGGHRTTPPNTRNTRPTGGLRLRLRRDRRDYYSRRATRSASRDVLSGV